MRERMRRLHLRGPTSRGVVVDHDGAMLGPDCVLVRRSAERFCCLSPEEAAALQNRLRGDRRKTNLLFESCRRIAKALVDGELAFAQILGLHIPIDGLDDGQVSGLAQLSPLIKANFNPDEPRIPSGSSDGGEWTAGSEASSGHITAAPGDEHPGREGRGGEGRRHPGANKPPIIPAQLTIPWDLPAEIPWNIPGAPSEITPLPFDFPGAERKRPPLPTNPFPRDPDCAAEWAEAYDYCGRMEKEGKFRPGYSGPGKDFRSCLLGRVSERCGGNAV